MTKQKKIRLKAVTVISLLLFVLTFLPPINFQQQETPFIFDHVKNEGYVAFIVNGYEPAKPDNGGNACDCNGEGTITHGDGHKTPCPCIGSGSECECKPIKSSKKGEVLIIEKQPEEIKIDFQPDVKYENPKPAPTTRYRAPFFKRMFGN
jgi:hypothetical protein